MSIFSYLIAKKEFTLILAYLTLGLFVKIEWICRAFSTSVEGESG